MSGSGRGCFPQGRMRPVERYLPQQPAPSGLRFSRDCLSEKVLQAFEDITFPVTYPEHAELISRNQPCRAVFALYSGRAKVSTPSRDGKKVMLRVAQPGEILGLSSVIAGTGYTVAAETLAPTLVRTAKREDFVEFVREYPEVNFALLSSLGEEYEQGLQTLRSLAWFTTASGRVAQLLLQMCPAATPAHEAKAKLLLTQEQIAQMAATTRETVTRLLAQLRREQVIQIRGSILTIRDRRALERLQL